MGAAGITSATIAGHIMNYPPSKYSDCEFELACRMQYLCKAGNSDAYIDEIKGETVALNYNIIRNPNITHGGHRSKWHIDSIPEIDKLRETKIGKLLCQ